MPISHNSMAGTDDDIFLLSLLKKGEIRSFNTIFDKYYVPLCRFVNININRYSVSEEIVQELFTNLWEKRADIDIRVSLKSYLFQAAQYRVINYIRDNRRMVFYDYFPFEKSYENEEIELKELQSLLQEAILSLPDKCGEIFRLSRERNMNRTEIAQSKNISVRTVDNHLSNAVHKIRQYLKKKYS